MSIIRVNLPNDGDTADVSDYNSPVNTIVNKLNGNLTDDNIAASPLITSTKVDFSPASFSTKAVALSTFEYVPDVGTNYTTTSTSATDMISTTYTAGDTNERVLVTYDCLINNNTNGAVVYTHLDQDGTALNPRGYVVDTTGGKWYQITRTHWVDVDANTATTLKLRWWVNTGTGSCSRNVAHHRPSIKGIAFYRSA